MCGIIGYVGSNNGDVVIEGLKGLNIEAMDCRNMLFKSK